ncbi:MAG: HAMP domain-containing protein [Betaproteobacteria bacterium]|nr:HAMP domain-containing protein [Betaproteobacteria bacterium]
MLALMFLLFELAAAGAVLGFLMLPIARRSADDLAGLMVLAAQTWNELPPQTRADFEAELAQSHQLVLRPDIAQPPDDGRRHRPYLYFLETALDRRVGQPSHLGHEIVAGEDWYWAAIPAGERRIGVGFRHGRTGTDPVSAILAWLALGLFSVLVVAWWLARRISRPLADFERAAASVGRGALPELLPETGPRELASLARHFNDMARRVRELLAARTTLLAGVSHDLRTPLARMRLALEMLAKKPNPALIARLDADVEEMNRLIGALLGLARGLESEAATDIDVAALLDELAAAARQGGAQVIVRVAAPMHVLAAPTALRRVLSNLLDNALRYGAGQPVELACENYKGAGEEDAGGCRIGVLDRGPGIPEEQMEAVFLPFHRVEGSRNPATGGTGLGLAIVRQLARANGWEVRLAAREGGGTAIRLDLPARHRPT